MSLQANMLNFAYSLTRNADDAQDLVQDTLLKAIASEEKYAADTNLKGWVLTIMRNIFINQYRKMVKLSTVHDETEDGYILNAATDLAAESPEDLYSTSEIEEAIREFQPMYRIPFVMLVSGYHYDEIAQEMNLPVGTVKSRIFYVRRLLQERFADNRR